MTLKNELSSSSSLLPTLYYYYYLRMVAAFIPVSVVAFTVLPNWNVVSKLVLRQENTESPKQQVFNNS
jgi:hypothetical protein